MTSSGVRVAAAIVRAWTRTYTSGLPAELRDARRDEIESDLWESAHDPGPSSRMAAVQMIARMLIGMPDDVGWRNEQAGRRVARRWSVALAIGVVAVVALWLVSETAKPKDIPEIRQLRFTNRPPLIDVPPPPPPPPPPCAPEGFPRDPAVRCTR
jgi:hypothetical protein